MRNLTLALVLLAPSACGEIPPYCERGTDTRHTGAWTVQHEELSGNCGPLDDVELVYPGGTPAGEVRYEAWLQGSCAYEGSSHYVRADLPPAVDPDTGEVVPGSQDRMQYLEGATQVASIEVDGEDRVVGVLTLERFPYHPDHEDVTCESRYRVTLTRAD